MKRVVKVSASSGDLSVKIEATIDSRNGLTRGEVERVARELARGMASDLRTLPYSDFGIENTRVRV